MEASVRANLAPQTGIYEQAQGITHLNARPPSFQVLQEHLAYTVIIKAGAFRRIWPTRELEDLTDQ